MTDTLLQYAFFQSEAFYRSACIFQNLFFLFRIRDNIPGSGGFL